MQLPQDIWPQVRNKILTNPLKCLFTVLALPGTEKNILQLKNHSSTAKEKILLVRTTKLIAKIQYSVNSCKHRLYTGLSCPRARWTVPSGPGESQKSLGLSENHTQCLSCPHLEPEIGELRHPKASLLHPSPSFAAVPELLGHERPKPGLLHTDSHLNHRTDTLKIQ